MKRIEFYIGISSTDRQSLYNYIKSINSNLSEEHRVEILGEFDDPYGYYELICTGTWNSYGHFNDMNGPTYIKSLQHYEEDNYDNID